MGCSLPCPPSFSALPSRREGHGRAREGGREGREKNEVFTFLFFLPSGCSTLPQRPALPVGTPLALAEPKDAATEG